MGADKMSYFNSIIRIDISDEIGPLLERMSGNFKKNLQSAGKSLGWFLQDEIKQGVRTGAPGGFVYTERRPYKVRKALGGGSAARAWYGKMVQAIGYQYRNGVVEIGWVSKTAAAYGRKQEMGYRTEVTEAIRQKFREAGYPLMNKTKYLILPDRPVFEPMAGVLQPKMVPYLRYKLEGYITETVVFSKKARRKYTVY